MVRLASVLPLVLASLAAAIAELVDEVPPPAPSSTWADVLRLTSTLIGAVVIVGSSMLLLWWVMWKLFLYKFDIFRELLGLEKLPRPGEVVKSKRDAGRRGTIVPPTAAELYNSRMSAVNARPRANTAIF